MPHLSSPILAPTTDQPATPRAIRLPVFNRLAWAAAVELAASCLAVPRWCSEVADGRPYDDLDALLEVARHAASPFTRPELDLALSAYLQVRDDDWLPAIDTDRYRTDESTAALRERIAEDSHAYLVRFGRPFVICPVGRSTPEVAVHLRRRLGHDSVTEDRVSAAALRQLGLLALVRQVGP